MIRKRRTLHQERYHRPILNEVLPFEVPPTFTNGGFFSFCSRINLRLERYKKEVIVSYENVQAYDKAVLDVIFPSKSNSNKLSVTANTQKKTVTQWGKSKDIYSGIAPCSMNTKALAFDISHREERSRELSIPHPRNQLDICGLYDRYHYEMVDICSRSPFSIRRPVRRAKTSFINDTIHKNRLSKGESHREEEHKEYENIASYFSYYKYSNVYRFYESRLYHRAERKFNFLIKQDISKCFDSIYTHTIAWSSHTKSSIKDKLNSSYHIFPSVFDTVQRSLNYNETNGIVIGPEFSRIFAELILQDIDVSLERILLRNHKLLNGRDYEIYRYVDDYFIFVNDSNSGDIISRALYIELRNKKLTLSSEKKIIIEKPLITSLTKAKDRIAATFNGLIEDIYSDSNQSPYETYYAKVNGNQLIKSIKAIISDTKTSYDETLNYFLTITSKECTNRCKKFSTTSLNLVKAGKIDIAKFREMKKFLISILEVLFFVGLAAPKVNFTLKISRIICQIVDSMEDSYFPQNHREDVLKYIDENLRIAFSKMSKTSSLRMETLYFLLAHGKLGRNYALPLQTLLPCFQLKMEAGIVIGTYFDFFTSTVVLTYIRNREKYSKLREFCFKSLMSDAKNRLPYKDVDSTFLISLLDICVCPYLTEDEKDSYIAQAGLPTGFQATVESASDQWFTEWKGFDLSIALDRKRLREVY